MSSKSIVYFTLIIHLNSNKMHFKFSLATCDWRLPYWTGKFKILAPLTFETWQSQSTLFCSDCAASTLSRLWHDFPFLDNCSLWTFNSWIADSRNRHFAWLSPYLLPVWLTLSCCYIFGMTSSNYSGFSALEESSIL